MRTILVVGVCALCVLHVAFAPPPGRAKATLKHKDILNDHEWLKKKFGLETIPSPVDRISKVTPEVFAEYIRAGKPVIITDVADDWAMRNWTCDTIQRDFGEEKIMAWNYNPQAGKPGKQYYKLKEDWRGAAMDLGGMRTADKKSPKQVSFHWYPIQQGAEEFDDNNGYDDGYTSTLASAKSRRKIKASWKLPYFVKDNPMNLEFCKNRIEFFLSMPGSGAALHADSVCEPIFSVQLAGSKQWRLGPVPPFTDVTHMKAADEFGRLGKWTAVWDTMLHPGEALFFPPSMLHETLAASEGCAVAASLQIRYPFAVGFIRDLGERLVHSNECAFCFEHWAPFIIGHKDGVREVYRRVVKNGGKESAIKGVLRGLFDAIDANGDGLVTRKEKTRHFVAEIRQHRGMVEYEADPEAEDWVAYNDRDQDGQVSWEEYSAVHAPLIAWYKRAVESTHGTCDEDGCGPWVRQEVLRGKTSGIESAYVASAGEKEDLGGRGSRDKNSDEDL